MNTALARPPRSLARSSIDPWSPLCLVDDVRPSMRRLRDADQPMVLATLYQANGSTPRSPGTQMLIAHDHVEGQFSGNCVEADVERHAIGVLDDGISRRLRYGAGSPWWDIRLACGSGIDIFLEYVAPDDAALVALLDLADRRTTATWQSQSDGHNCVVSDDLQPTLKWSPDPFMIERRFNPVDRLFIVGHDPVAIGLTHLAALAAFETHLIVPFGPEHGPAIGGVKYHRSSAKSVFGAFPPDAWTSVIVATHEAGTVDAALAAAFDNAAGYVGVVGAAHRRSALIERLIDAGSNPDRVEQVHMPVGMAGLGKAPWDVAVSILADVMRIRNERVLLSGLAL